MTTVKPKTAMEAARLIRASIKQAAQDGSLGELPAGVTFSVTAPKMGLARPVHISIQNGPAEWTCDTAGRLGASDAAERLAWALRDFLVQNRQTGRVDLDGWILCGA